MFNITVQQHGENKIVSSKEILTALYEKARSTESDSFAIILTHAITNIKWIEEHGIRYSNQDFDVLSTGFKLLLNEEEY
jgi:hypothetical protein